MINIDADLRNADWIRTRTWDLPTDVDRFLAVIGGRSELEHFMTLPAAEAMPETLRMELELLGSKFRKYDDSEPRDDSGRWTAGGGGGPDPNAVHAALYGEHAGTPQDPVPCAGDIERAAKIIADGGNVTLAQPQEISTLLDKMQSMVQEAQAAGKDAPVFDLCNASVEGTNLFCQDHVTDDQGNPLDRVQMPQLATKDPAPGSVADGLPRNQFGEVDMSTQFAEFLSETGRPPEETTIDAKLLRASQDELNGAKVAGIADAIASGAFDPTTGRIWVTSDNYVIDGHHRWAATVAEEYATGSTINIPVRRLDMDIGTALTTATYWTEEMGIAGAGLTAKAYRLMIGAAALGISMKFDDSEPRDDAGRWTSGGAGGVFSTTGADQPLKPIDPADLDESKVYHVAPEAARADIARDGLRADVAARYAGDQARGVYLWRGYNEAVLYARGEARSFDASFDVWEVPMPSTVHADPTLGENSGAGYTTEPITDGRLLGTTTGSGNDDMYEMYADEEPTSWAKLATYNLALDALEAFGFSIKFDDSQPRDENGRWTAGGGGGAPATTFHEQTAAWADQNLYVEPYLHTVQKIAVQEYTRTGWEHINSALRREGGPFTDAAGNSLTEIEQRDVANIALAIDGSPLPEDLVMWRGASDLPAGFRPGATFYDQAFTSASLSRDVAQSFAGDGYTVRIEAPAGTKALYAGSMDATSHDETEMLLGRAQPFTVQSIDEASRVVSVRAGRA